MARRGLKNTKVRIAAIGAGLAIGAAVITGVASASVAGPPDHEGEPVVAMYQAFVDCEIGEEGAKLASPRFGEIRETESDAQNDLSTLVKECEVDDSGVVLTREVLEV
jgi:hypothetical protein